LKEAGGTERHSAIAAALPLLHPQHHPLAIDVADLELTGFAPT
jgi:hypothetical protein